MAYQFDSRIRYSETDADRRLRLTALVDYFQDCSTFHSEDCGCGLDYLGAQDLAWMVLSWQIEPVRLPRLGERVTAATWPYGFRAFYGYRNFALYDERGAYLARANSIWVLMNVRTGRPVKVSPEIMKLFPVEPRLDMKEAPRKLPMPPEYVRMESFPVGVHHLDTNHHVNNGQYISMAEEYLPEEFQTGRLLVEYRSQAHLHDEIVPLVYRTDGCVTVALADPEEKPYAIVEFFRNTSE